MTAVQNGVADQASAPNLLPMETTKSIITADSYFELTEQLRRIDISVPRISRGRTKLHTERWTMYRFLATHGDLSEFVYPLTVVHKDRPDFRIEMHGRKIGVEVTSAMPEEYARALALRDKHYPNSPMEPDYFRWGSPKRTNRAILRILMESQSRLSGPGWVGDSVEREWAVAICAAFQSKTKVLNAKGFKRYQWNGLLVHDNVPQVGMDLEAALIHLRTRLKAVSESLPASWRTFSALFIESHERFVAVETGSSFVRSVNNIWRDRGS